MTLQKQRNRDQRPSRQGLDWGAIRREREARQGEEAAALERELSPFDEHGNLKGSTRREMVAEEKAKVRAGRKVDVARAVELYRDQNMTVPQVAKEMDCSEATVRNVLRDEGVYVPHRDRKRDGANGKMGVKGPRTANWDVIKLRWDAGDTVMDISRATGYHKDTVRNALKGMGIDASARKGKSGNPTGRNGK